MMRPFLRLTGLLAGLLLAACMASLASAQTTTDQLNKLSLESLTQPSPARPSPARPNQARPSTPYAAPAPRHTYGRPRTYRGHPHRYGLYRGRPPYRYHPTARPRHYR